MGLLFWCTYYLKCFAFDIWRAYFRGLVVVIIIVISIAIGILR